MNMKIIKMKDMMTLFNKVIQDHNLIVNSI